MNFKRLEQLLNEQKQPAYRFAQAKQGYFVDRLSDWGALSVYAKSLRETCSTQIPWDELRPIQIQESRKGDTVKTLFACQDEKKIEAVLMRHADERDTVCVSSQVGCSMACSFCATRTMGLARNLSAEEMVAQVMHYARWLKPHKAHVTNVVLMGMGEPFHNYDESLRALRILNDPEGFCLGARRMSLSTCGVVPGILRLADEDMQINLAISLHAATDAKRSRLMPVNKVYPLAKLRSAVQTYIEKTNRKVLFEYLLLQGINDTEEDARALATWLGPDRRLFHVNLIKYHETKTFHATPPSDRMKFLRLLHTLGVPSTHRMTFGEDIAAACGQLAV